MSESILFTGGTIWRGMGLPEASDLLIREGAVAAFGAEARAQGASRVIDLAGGFLMPSFGEGHAHPIFGGLEWAGPQITGVDSVEGIVEAVRDYAAQHPEQEWILGASYNGSLVEEGLFQARWLDEAVPDRPVVLRAWDYHTLWCNSKALELAGITAQTPEPELGQIPRDADGAPLGVLREWGAVDLMQRVNPGYDFEQRVAALAAASAHLASLGIGWVQDAWVQPEDVEVYLAAAERGLLKNRFNLALLADPREFPGSLPRLLDSRHRVEQAGHELLTAQSVKFFVDGVVENQTGALLEPYCSTLHDHGLYIWQAEPLARAVGAVDAAGFQAHLHAIGDGAVRRALDAIEAAARANGPSTHRPVIAHVQLADGADLQRFVKLGVIPVMQPLWAQLDDLMTVLTVPRLGAERAARQYQLHTLQSSGAPLAFGSDWPCSEANPLAGIAVAVGRMTAQGYPEGGWVPEQRLDAETALAAYTAGVAHQAFADRLAAPWGVLEPGASADLVVLERDPRKVLVSELADVKVVATYLAGHPSFSRWEA
ncbi:amidohydrolase [Glutamicibacter sp. PS]|uniref:amidohydrolase n=1 Tax=Glutamicibacter sp. PS TaxID=3075634 RepID=UPI002843DC35|nr:amidohydrolase [Glutamicibacter sp. PS]MDR4534359.1 amidohydrolase [Glutamicibacter sp. PS]